jgi:hypothetical protein
MSSGRRFVLSTPDFRGGEQTMSVVAPCRVAIGRKARISKLPKHDKVGRGVLWFAVACGLALAC